MKPCAIDEIETIVRGHAPAPVGDYRYYAVLLPLVEKEGELFVLYEVRADDLAVQPGEISFPGGAVEAGETPEAAAVRETCEELCVPDSAVRVLHELNYLITYSGFTLYSFLGVLDADALSATRPSAAEVKETFLVPLAWLLEHEPDVYENRVVPEPTPDLPVEKLFPGGVYKWRTGRSTVMVYTWPDAEAGTERVIWGMTAALTRDFITLLKTEKRP